MRLYTLLLSLFLCIPLVGQNGKGNISNPISGDFSVSTYAVVVGISDYQDEDIPDLQFADKDALAFAGYLQSAAGGSLDKDHLRVLINEQATQAQFAAALDWMWEVVQENDKAIIYFSGHGDVERKSFTQPGYLLCWDAPAHVYMGGGAFPVAMLQEVTTTLSLSNNAKVVLITDACRAGKLSGSHMGGTQLTSANLSRQWNNEIKILSCQPDEYSIEGEQWGGGRGAFSYHLLNGLYGLADENEDQTVSVREIERYLEDHVTPEVAPQDQLPMIIGDSREVLVPVDPQLLAQLVENRKGEMPLFTSVESRGLEDIVLEAADSSVVEMYDAFKNALEDKQFLFAEEGLPENDYADYYYEKLITEPSLERLYSTMTRNYAAALQDDAQQVMNNWMKSSEERMLERERGETNEILPRKVFTEKVKVFPDCLDRAAELLGKGHYMYSTLKARKHFFEGYLIANANQNPSKETGERAMSEFRQSLQWQQELPHTYWQMSLVQGFNFLRADSAEFYANKAVRMSSNWLLPYLGLANLLTDRFSQFERAVNYLEKAEQIDPNSISVLNEWGIYYNRIMAFDQAEEQYKKAFQIDSSNLAVVNNLGLVYFKTRRYALAERYYNKALELDSTHWKPWFNMGTVYRITRRYDRAEQYFNKALQLDSNRTDIYKGLGLIYSATRRFDKAEQYYKKALHLDNTNLGVINNLAIVYASTGRNDLAEQQFAKAIQIDSTYSEGYYNLGEFYFMNGRYEAAEENLKKVLEFDSTDAGAYMGLGLTYTATDRYEEAETNYIKAISIDSSNWQIWANLGLLYQTLKRWEESAEIFQKTIALGPPIGEFRTLLGKAYLHMPGYIEQAKDLLDMGLEMSPNYPDTYILLAQWSIMTDQNDQAWDFLEKGLEKGIGKGHMRPSYLQEESDFEEMRKDPKWDKLMKKARQF